MKILRYKKVQSTSTLAYRLADRGAEDWTVVLSEVQTQGRGRRGRRWKSPKGGLWFSVITKPRIETGQVPLLQFLTANASRRGIGRASGLMPGVKWPNDLVLDSQKLGGILVESKLLGNHVNFAIIGIGVNLNLHSGQLPRGATSLFQTSGRHYELESMLHHILKSLVSEYERPWDPARVISEWWQNCIHREKRVEIETTSGTMNGISTGIDLNGHLILETDDGKRNTVGEGRLRVSEP